MTASAVPTTPLANHPSPLPGSLRRFKQAPLAALAVWVLLVVGVLSITLAGVPAAYELGRTLSPATQATVERLGLTPALWAGFLVGLDLALIVFFTSIALLMVWRRWRDWMVLLVALMLVLTATLYTAPLYLAPAPLPIIAGICALAEISQISFVFLFPSGRCVPRWMCLLLLPLFIWRPLVWGLLYLPNYLTLPRDGDHFGVMPQNTLDIAAFALLFVIGIGAQVYRFHRVSTPIERQQTKWLLLGVAVVVLVVATYTIVIHTLGVLQEAGQEVLLRLAGRTVRQIALCVVPLTLAYSILRYRLWEIDRLISRALVYTLLTGVLVAVYVGGVVVLQGIVRALTGQQSDVAVVASTLASAALFQPLRGRLQAFIDRRFFRRRYDAAQTLATFSAALRDEVDLERLAASLQAVVTETMQPVSASLWLRPTAGVPPPAPPPRGPR